MNILTPDFGIFKKFWLFNSVQKSGVRIFIWVYFIFSILRNDVEDMHTVKFIHLWKEQCILVNENDQELGSASKRTCHLKDPFTHKAPLHRAFSLFIFNKENQLLLQQRSDTKVTFPGKTSI